LEGRNTIWQTNGSKQKEVFYKEGAMEGPSTTWWVNGVIQEKGYYKTGEKTGRFSGFHENGVKAYEATFEKGKMIKHQTWSPNGQITSKGEDYSRDKQTDFPDDF
jgi:antitoxin component YwqK of YwqJK toxin-antitoxin module